MSNPSLTQAPIGQHEGWDLFVCMATGLFLANNKRKNRSSQSLLGIKREVEDANFEAERAAERAKLRVENVRFTYYDKKAGTFTEVEMTSFSDKGVALKPVAGGDTLYLKPGYGDEQTINVLIGSEKPVHEAIEAVRRAKEQLRLAIRGNVHEVKLPSYNSGRRSRDNAVEEDRLRTEILATLKVRP